MNKDEAVKCRQLAQRLYNEKNLPQALRFFEKAYRMDPKPEIMEIISKIKNELDQELKKKTEKENEEKKTNKNKKNQNKKNQNQNDNQNKNHNNNNNINATNTPNDDPQKVIEIKKVLKKKCLYEVLEVEKTADLTQIKSSYRKLAMKFHPDRNKTTGSAEAFKKIGQAYSILSDETKRKRYDQFGDESEVNISTPTFRYRRNGDPRHYYYSEFGPEFNPFDLFDFFFEMQDYSSVRMQNRRRNHRQRRQPQQEESNIISLILRFSPFLLFFILILSTKLFETEETFSFTRQGNYVLKKETENLGIKYYVKKDFKTTTQGWINLEANVEYQYLSNLRQECQSDMFWNNNRKNIPPSCKEYYKYQKS